jgi:N6-adenosine-specific RNA methylase IME4
MNHKSQYRTVCLDPPWFESGGGKIKRGADRHYELLKTKAMPKVIFDSGVFNVFDDAHMYMWATNNHLPDALWLIKELGFRYVTNVVWPKRRAGLGQYFRGKHELLLFAVRGRGKADEVMTSSKSLTTVLDIPEFPRLPLTRVHSRKPEESFALIEARSKGPYLEMFADPALPVRPGWYPWGAPKVGKPPRVRVDEPVPE